MLGEIEKERFATYSTPRWDRSITSRVFHTPLKQFLKMVPVFVAPNVLSLAALLCSIQAWYLCTLHSQQFPLMTAFFSVFMAMAFYTLDALAPRHAVAIGNNSSLTEFFDHVCSSVASMFLVLTVAQVYELRNLHTVYYLVQINQMVLLIMHLGAFQHNRLVYRLFTGPGEAVWLFVGMMSVRGLLGERGTEHSLHWVLDKATPYAQALGVKAFEEKGEDLVTFIKEEQPIYQIVALVYVLCFVLVIFRVSGVDG